MAVVVVSAVGCGAPTVQQAAQRVPNDGTSVSFGRPYADVYAAAERVIEQAIATPEWKELRVVHDDPEGGALIAERKLEGVIPGLRVRDLWSFYFTRTSPELTTVTFVIDSSDWPRGSSGVRSWTKARSEIFPAMAETLGPPVTPPTTTAASDERAEPATTTAREVSPATAPVSAPAPAPAPAPAAAQVAQTSASARPESGLTLGRLHAALEGSEEWRRSIRRRTIRGDDIVTVGDWAQLAVRGERVEVAFPSYPAPPAYDVARLMRFLGDAGFAVDVLPGTAFRAP